MKHIEQTEFWDEVECPNPPLTQEMIRMAQETLGVVLPTKYIAVLHIQNGGYSRGFVFPTKVPTSWAEDHVSVDELYGIGNKDDISGSHNIFDTTYLTKEWGLPAQQVILAGDGHYWITLDYRHRSIPSVAWIDVEVGEDLQLAASFDEFMAGLLPAEFVDEEACRLKKFE